MQCSGHIGAFLTSTLLCTSAYSLGSQELRGHLQTLVAARQVHDLSSEEASRAYPVHLHAVVTYFDPDLNDLPDLFVHDSTGSIFVEFSEPPNLKLRPGDLVDVVGVSGPGDYAPVIDHPRVKLIAHSHLPEFAQRVSFSQLLSGSLDGQWVEIEGVVHAAHLTRSNVTIDLATAGGSLRATTVRELGVDYEAFVDSLIRLRGNAAPVFNWKEQMVGAQLIFPSLRNAKILEAAPHDPFAMTVVPFSQVIRFSPSEEIPHRVHVRGRVTLQWPGRKLCIQQGNDSLCLETAQTDRVREGSLVDAVGFPATSAYKETLENATFRPAVGANLAILARPVTADEALRGDYDGQLVQIQGQLVALEHLGGDLQLMLRSGGFLIPAVLPSNLAGAGTLPWKEGSILRLTGLCNSQAGTETWNLRNGEVQPGSIQVLLRSIEDVQIVELPSWWTPRHVLGILAVVGFGSLAAASWIVILRRRVDQQTMALRKSEERLRHLSQHDALTRLPNRILLNDRMDVALNRAERFHESVGLLMVDIDRFKETNDLYGHQAGDRLLCEVASRIKGSVRKTDTVARIGGDEFIVLLPDLHETEEAELIATKILAAVSSPIELGNVSVTTSVSIGVCTYPEGGTDSEALLQSADAAMYSAKASGRNAVQVTRPMNTLIH